MWSAASRRTAESWNTSEADAGIDLLGFERALNQVEDWLPGAGRPAGAPARSVTLFLDGLQRLGIPSVGTPEPEERRLGASDDLSHRSVATFDTLIPWGQKRFGEDSLQVMTGCRRACVLKSMAGSPGSAAASVAASCRIDAGTVVLSAGAIHSTKSCARATSAVTSAGGLSFDLAAGMTARFPSIIDAWDGVQLATEVDNSARGFVAETRWQEPSTQALLMPGWFGQHTRNMQHYRQMMALRIHLGADRRGRNLLVPFSRPSTGIELRDQELADLLDRLQMAGESCSPRAPSRSCPIR